MMGVQGWIRSGLCSQGYHSLVGGDSQTNRKYPTTNLMQWYKWRLVRGSTCVDKCLFKYVNIVWPPSLPSFFLFLSFQLIYPLMVFSTLLENQKFGYSFLGMEVYVNKTNTVEALNWYTYSEYLCRRKNTFSCYVFNNIAELSRGKNTGSGVQRHGINFRIYQLVCMWTSN